MNCLKNFITNTGTIDLGFRRNIFTWRNVRSGLGQFRQYLDRTPANDF